MESEFTIDAAMQFRDIAAAAAEIIQCVGFRAGRPTRPVWSSGSSAGS